MLVFVLVFLFLILQTLPDELKSSLIYQTYVLTFCGGSGQAVLISHLRKYCIVKLPQIELAYKYILQSQKRTSRLLTTEHLRQKREIFQNLKQLKEEYLGVIVAPDRVTIAYTCGLFDAEGCITTRTRSLIYASITQANCPQVLHAINANLFQSTGYVHPIGRLGLGSDNAIKLLKDALEYCVVKRPEIEKALELYNLRSLALNRRTYPQDLVHEMDIIQADIKKLKRS